MQGWIDLHERLEDALDHARRNSFSRVANTNDGMVVFQSGGDPDSAARVGVLGGIVEEVGQNLFEPSGVPFQAHDLAGKRNRQLVSALIDQRATRLNGMLDDLCSV